MHNVVDWDKQACNLLKSELARRGLSYEDLRLALERIGIQKTKNNITKTISLGKFPFSFFLQCAQAIGLTKLHISDE